jgi:hypothetical protein
MLTEQEFQAFAARFCNGTSWTATFLEPGGRTRWRCNDCGKVVQDNLTISASLIFGPHYKPEWAPVPVVIDPTLPGDTIKAGDVTLINIKADKP